MVRHCNLLRFQARGTSAGVANDYNALIEFLSIAKPVPLLSGNVWGNMGSKTPTTAHSDGIAADARNRNYSTMAIRETDSVQIPRRRKRHQTRTPFWRSPCVAVSARLGSHLAPLRNHVASYRPVVGYCSPLATKPAWNAIRAQPSPADYFAMTQVRFPRRCQSRDA